MNFEVEITWKRSGFLETGVMCIYIGVTLFQNAFLHLHHTKEQLGELLAPV